MYSCDQKGHDARGKLGKPCDNFPLKVKLQKCSPVQKPELFIEKMKRVTCVFASLLCALYIILSEVVSTNNLLTKHPRNPAVTRIFIHKQYNLTTSRNVPGRAKGLGP